MACGSWESRQGPLLFSPTKISTRFWTALHVFFQPLLKRINRPCVMISLGLPYRHYLLGKTFPHFAFQSPLRVLWTYDAWEPRFSHLAELVRETHVGLLLLTSRQATEHFQALNLPDCEVHWVPENLDVRQYQRRPWAERTIDILSFGRGYARYHEAIVARCKARGLKYVFKRFETGEELLAAMGDAKISLCFPQSLTHPERVGKISTVTLRYLQSVASKCVIVGSSPVEAEEMFGHNPVIAVDWADPVGQLQEILTTPGSHLDLVEKNYATVAAHHQTSNFVARVEALIAARLARQRQ